MERIPFRKSELEVKEYIKTRPQFDPLMILNTPISPKDNYMAMLKGETPLWVPSTVDVVSLIPKVVPDNRARGFIIDAEPLKPGEAGGPDLFGINWEMVPGSGAAMIRPGSEILEDANDWEKVIKFPDLTALDWEHSGEVNKKILDPDRVKSIWCYNGLFERLMTFMGTEGALMAMIDEDQQDAVKALFSRLCDMYEVMIDLFIKYYDMDVLFFHDDWGTQRAPFFSLDTVREMLVPYIRRLTDYVHSKGKCFELHCCGKNELIVPAMIEGGVDAWSGQPINDKAMLFDKYGDKFIFGIEFPPLPKNASDEECYASAKEYFDRYCSDMSKKKVICMMKGITQKQQEYLYVMTRKALCGEA